MFVFVCADIPVLCPGLFYNVIVERHGWWVQRLHPDFSLSEQAWEKGLYWLKDIQSKSLYLSLYVKVWT